MFRTALIASLLLAAAPHSAAAQEPLPTIEVPHADLDLSTVTGQDRLDRRIRNAAAILCPQGALMLAAQLERKRCLRVVVAKAEAQVREAVAAAGGIRKSPRFAGAVADERS